MLLPIMLYISVVPKDVKENFISLRERDFVGEDKRLRAMLAQRLAVLQGDVNLTDLQQPDSSELILRRLTASEDHSDLELEKDYLELNHTRKIPNNLRFNVSMDYAELFNFSIQADEAWLAKFDGRPENLTGPLVNFGSRPGNHSKLVVPGDPASNQTGAHVNLNASRRAPAFHSHSELDSNLHILEIMKQEVYMVQERLLDIEDVITFNQEDVRFRIAYVFNRLDEWFQEMRTFYYAMSRERWDPWRVKKLLFYYEHILRKNIDITYSVEFLIHMHINFMAKMEEIMPREQRESMKNARNPMGMMNQSAYEEMEKKANKEEGGPGQGGRRRMRLPRL